MSQNVPHPTKIQMSNAEKRELGTTMACNQEISSTSLRHKNECSPRPASRQQSSHSEDEYYCLEETSQGAGSGEPNAQRLNKDAIDVEQNNHKRKEKKANKVTKVASNNNLGDMDLQRDSPLLRIASCESLSSPRPLATDGLLQCEPFCRGRVNRNRQRPRQLSRERVKEPTECIEVVSKVKGDSSRKYNQNEKTNERTMPVDSKRPDGSKFTSLSRATLAPLKIYDQMQRKNVKGMNVAEFNRYQANKRLRENIAKIQRSKAKVDCHMDPKLMDNSYRVRRASRQRMEEHSKLARENLKFSETLQGPKSDYDRESHLNDFKKNYVAMVKLGRHTDLWQPPKGVRTITVRSKVEPCDCLSSTSLDLSDEH